MALLDKAKSLVKPNLETITAGFTKMLGQLEDLRDTLNKEITSHANEIERLESLVEAKDDERIAAMRLHTNITKLLGE